MYTRPTFLDCKLSLAYRYGELAVPQSGDSNRNHWINKSVEYFCQHLFSKKETAVVADGTVDLPDDFRNIKDRIIYDADENPYKQISEDDQFKYGGQGYVFWISGNPSDGYVLNTFTDGTFTYFYRFFPVPMSGNTDTCIIPDVEAVSAYAYAYLRKSETDPLGDADKALNEAETRLRDMIHDKTQNENDLIMKTLDE